MIVTERILGPLKLLTGIANVIRFGLEDKRDEREPGPRQLKPLGLPESVEPAVQSFVEIDVPPRIGFGGVVAE